MRILVLSEKSEHTRRLLRYALAPHGYEILLLHRNPWSQQDIDAYRESGASEAVAIFDISRWKNKKTKLGKWCALCAGVLRTIKKFQPDVVNLQFVDTFSVAALFFTIGFSRRFILSFWGSDLLRQKKWLFLRVIYPLALCRANMVTFDSLNMLDRLHYLYGKKYDHKIQIVRFCNPIIEILNKMRVQYTRDEMRDRFGFPTDGRIIVSIGYCNIKEHNHLRITQAIGLLPKKVQEKLFLVYPMTYGETSSGYLTQIEEERGKLFCESLVLREYLTEEECACLYLSVDGFIHAQTTDAYSQTFVDYIYAGATVFQAKWLHYPEIDSYGLNLYEFADYSQLTQLLKDYVDDFPVRSLIQTPSAIDILYKTESSSEIAKRMKIVVEGDNYVSNSAL